MIARHDIAGRDLPDLSFPVSNIALWERRPVIADAPPVLYVHGATFPTELAFTFAFDGVSWADHLAGQGFWPWGLDFTGFGASAIDWDAVVAEAGPIGKAADAAQQIAAACALVHGRTGAARIDLIAHSWGTIPARLFAAQRPDLVRRLALFGPIVCRDGPAKPRITAPWRLVTADDQRRRFLGYVPSGHAPLLADRHFARWAAAYLDSDPYARNRTPAAVKIPTGPAADIQDTWSGERLYPSASITAETAILRGEWDSLCTDADAANLTAELTAARAVHDIKLPAGTHVMHLETGRMRLWDAAARFLHAG